jgi:hypothetical protein
MLTFSYEHFNFYLFVFTVKVWHAVLRKDPLNMLCVLAV